MTPETRAWLESHESCDSFEEPGNGPRWAEAVKAAKEATPEELRVFFDLTVNAANLAMFAIRLPPGPALVQAYEAHTAAHEQVRAAYVTLRAALLALPEEQT